MGGILASDSCSMDCPCRQPRPQEPPCSDAPCAPKCTTPPCCDGRDCATCCPPAKRPGKKCKCPKQCRARESPFTKAMEEVRMIVCAKSNCQCKFCCWCRRECSQATQKACCPGEVIDVDLFDNRLCVTHSGERCGVGDVKTIVVIGSEVWVGGVLRRA